MGMGLFWYAAAMSAGGVTGANEVGVDTELDDGVELEVDGLLVFVLVVAPHPAAVRPTIARAAALARTERDMFMWNILP